MTECTSSDSAYSAARAKAIAVAWRANFGDEQKGQPEQAGQNSVLGEVLR